jgi:hypothetical protein
VSRSAPKAALLGAIGTTGIFGVLEVISNFVKPLFGNKILTFRPQIATVDNGIDELPGVGAQATTSWDFTDTLET